MCIRDSTCPLAGIVCAEVLVAMAAHLEAVRCDGANVVPYHGVTRAIPCSAQHATPRRRARCWRQGAMLVARRAGPRSIRPSPAYRLLRPIVPCCQFPLWRFNL